MPPSPPPPLADHLESFWRRLAPLLPAGAMWCVGCSGGLDSSVLWRLAVELADKMGGIRLAAAHLHHGLRGRAADLDMDLVQQACRDAGRPFIGFTADVAARAAAWRAGLEEAGRRVRRAVWTCLAAAEAAAGRPPPLIWLGHHADDQAETVLFRLRRGAARRGCAGLRPVQPFGPWPERWGDPRKCFSEVETIDPDGWLADVAWKNEDSRGMAFPAGQPLFRVLRPLLGHGKETLASFARAGGVLWREDATNDDTRFARNAIRHQRLPELEKKFPNLRSRLLAVAAAAAAREERECARAHAWLRGAWLAPARGNDGAIRFLPLAGRAAEEADLPRLPDSPAFRRLALREALERATGSLTRHRDVLERLDQLALAGRNGQRLSLPGGWLAERNAWGIVFYGPEMGR